MAEGPSRNTLQRLLNTRVVIWISKWKKGASAPPPAALSSASPTSSWWSHHMESNHWVIHSVQVY